MDQTKPTLLNPEQQAALQSCIDWYTEKVFRGRTNKADYNPPEMVTTDSGTVVRYKKSLHVLSPAFWVHYHYDHLLRAFNDEDAARRIVEFRATMESPHCGTE